MGTVAIAGNLAGGAGNFSGEVFCDSTLAQVTIHGDIVGSAGTVRERSCR